MRCVKELDETRKMIMGRSSPGVEKRRLVREAGLEKYEYLEPGTAAMSENLVIKTAKNDPNGSDEGAAGVTRWASVKKVFPWNRNSSSSG